METKSWSAGEEAVVPTSVGRLSVAVQGEPDRPSAVLWPSLFTDGGMWRHQIIVLIDAGYRTVTIDPPGQGRSEPPKRPFSMDACADAVVAILDATDVHQPAVLLGTSWGGFVMPRVALRRPDRVQAMALFNTSADRPTPMDLARARLLSSLLSWHALDGVTEPAIMSSLLAPKTRRGEVALVEELRGALHGWDRRGLAIVVKSVLVNRQPFVDSLPRIAVPALIIAGGEDRTLPAAYGRRLANRISNARFAEVPGAAHLVPLEAPEAVNRLLIEFLKTIGRAA